MAGTRQQKVRAPMEQSSAPRCTGVVLQGHRLRVPRFKHTCPSVQVAGGPHTVSVAVDFVAVSRP